MFSSPFFLPERDHRCNRAWGSITVQRDSRPEMRMHPPSEAFRFGGGTLTKKGTFMSILTAQWGLTTAACEQLRLK